jgi:NADH-quinone oxidoreductase subunit J
MELGELIHTGMFYAFGTLAIIASLMVVLSRNSVHAALFLVLAFVATSGLWLLAQAEFLAITLVLVYVGAVMVLFLFVVMMLDVELNADKQKLVRYFPLAILVAVAFVAVLIFAFLKDKLISPALIPVAEDYSNIKSLGQLLYTQYLLPFEVAGILLTVAIVAAIGLTFRGRREAKSPHPSKQVLATKANRLKIISVGK